MCRLIALRAAAPVDARYWLLDAPHSLVKQSCCDLTQERHEDGWGLAAYGGDGPVAWHGTDAAGGDPYFNEQAEAVDGTTILAHVRNASVGGRSLANTHPFVWGRWVFAHNGTLTGWERLGPELLQETLPQLREARRGQTDSETAFYWLLSRLVSAGISIEDASQPSPAEIGRVAARGVRQLAARCAAAAPEQTAKLNFILTDGRLLVATRWRASLHWRRDAEPEQVVVASEPVDGAGWQELPDESILTVDGHLNLQIQPL